MSNSIHIITNKQQLTFIQECIKVALQTKPAMANIKDELDDDLGEVLVDMIDTTLDNTFPSDCVHGFIL